MKKIVTFLILIVSLSSSAQDASHDLIVKIENVKSSSGKIRVGLYDCEEKFLKEAIQGSDIQAGEGLLIVTFKGLKRGEYAVSLFHDENKNGKLDSNFIGIPTEPYAFSNNAKGMFGPPDFKECRFEVKEGNIEITIRL
ncbi:MAG: DUF2141 domain-containing protein [Cyclobacteriaceae bacterium]